MNEWIRDGMNRLKAVEATQKKLGMGSSVGSESQVTAEKLQTCSVVDGEVIIGEKAGLRAAAYMKLRLDGVDVDSPREWIFLRRKKAKFV